jgi:hypothetical protein
MATTGHYFGSPAGRILWPISTLVFQSLKYTVVQPGFHCYQWSWPVRIHRIFLSYIIDKNNTILVALGTLVFVNGMVHLVLSIFTFSYSPGTISSVVLFIPLGIIIFKRILP